MEKYPSSKIQLRSDVRALIERIKNGDETAECLLLDNIERYRGYRKAVVSALLGIELKHKNNERWARIRTSSINKGGVWPFRK